MFFEEIIARKILNSRKEETIEVITKSDKIETTASSPSGRSVGKYEVSAFSKKGVDFSMSAINVIGKKLCTEKVSFETFDDLEKIDTIIRRYDTTKNLSIVGGNALYALQCSILKCIAASQEQSLWKFLHGDKKAKMPMPIGNCIGGGMHAQQKKKTDIQEFLFIPLTDSFFDAQFVNKQAYKEAQSRLAKEDKGWNRKVNDENALASTLDDADVLKLCAEIRGMLKETFNMGLEIGIDVAASSLFHHSGYFYNNRNKNRVLSRKDQVQYILEIIKEHGLFYVEDPLQEEDFSGFSEILKKARKALIVGDDLTVTHPERLALALKEKAINALIVKPNQIGSLIEMKKVIEIARQEDIVTIMSHRSGETLDNALAHFAVGFQTKFIKTGIVGKERESKLNELVRIEKEI